MSCVFLNPEALGKGIDIKHKTRFMKIHFRFFLSHVKLTET